MWVLNRNAEGKLFPSSPLEAHKNHAIVTHLIGVDQVGLLCLLFFYRLTRTGV